MLLMTSLTQLKMLLRKPSKTQLNDPVRMLLGVLLSTLFRTLSTNTVKGTIEDAKKRNAVDDAIDAIENPNEDANEKL